MNSTLDRFGVSLALMIAWAAGPCLGASGTITASPVNFGDYQATNAAPCDSWGTVTFQCVGSTAPIRITLSSGLHSGFCPREMEGPLGGRLQYNLYLDAARQAIWGDGTGGSLAFTSSGPPPAQPVILNVYGRIPARQMSVTPGLYTDTILVTLYP